MNTLKFFFNPRFLSVWLLGLLSCKDQDSPLSKSREIDFSKLKPAVTPKGSPLGSVFTRVIGAAGGVVQSPDGQISIDIPAGALNANTTIGIQTITNQAPLGTGYGYRLTPEGTVFAKPVKITMKYGEGVAAPFVWVVTQKSDGTWLGNLNSEPDEATRTVSVQTTHFSDWAVGRLIDLRLSPEKATLKVKQSLKLSITGFAVQKEEDDYLMPLAPVHAPDDEELAALPDLSAAGRLLVKLNKYGQMDFKEWRLDLQKAPASGNKGKLEATGSEAVYTAPDNVPEPEEVAVSVYVQAQDKKGGGSAVSIVTPIRIVKNEYFLTLYLDGKKIEYIQPRSEALAQGLGIASIRVRENELLLQGYYSTNPNNTDILNLSINDRIMPGTQLYQRDKSRTPYTTLTFTRVDRSSPQYVNESATVSNNPNAGCFHSPIPIPVELTLNKTTKNGKDYYDGRFSCRIYYVSPTECKQPEEHTITGVFNLEGN